jgi:large subunit ribosomal protein L2
MILSKYKKKIKYLFSRKKKSAGRNNLGRITVAHQGGGHKRLYRKIYLGGNFPSGIVINFEYDPNRSARIAKICYKENNIKKYYYILAPQNLRVLDKIESSENFEGLSKKEDLFQTTVTKQVGSCYFLHEFNVGDFIYNIEIIPNTGGQLVRAGGTSAVVLQKSLFFLTVKLPSGEHRMISTKCRAFFGNLSNENHKNIIWQKAGKSRWLNIRPTVRGVAKNPIDHPHGGNTSGGCHPKTPWARLTKGKPTRSKKKLNKLILKRYKS